MSCDGPPPALIHGVLKITTIENSEGVTLRLEGRLVGPWVAEFNKAVGACGKRALTVDLTDTTYVDAAGRKALAGARDRGAHLITAGALMAALVAQVPGLS